jgi:hypothetical protein
VGNLARIQLMGNARSDKETAGTNRYILSRLNAKGVRERIVSFDTQEDLQEAMNFKDEQGRDVYHNDAAYRETIREVIANSPKLMAEPTLARRSVIPDNETFLKGLKHDALVQRRNELTEQAGGSDAIAKYNAALALTDPENYEAAQEMAAETEVATPYADMLRSRKAAGLGPLTWNFAVDADTAHPGHGEGVAGQADSDGHIIQIEGE